jgi:uncharacterized protein YecT (DUF1311 family)
MKTFTAALIVLVLSVTLGLASTREEKGTPCAKEQSNAGMRQCYTREQTRVNAEADSAAKGLADDFRRQAQDPSLGPVVAGELLKAASGVVASQKLWKAYRDQHCNAVAHSWTTGSGAGTAAEECLFRLGQERLRELHTAFN